MDVSDKGQIVVKITLIGWYGTETIGDRAILAGIFSFLSSAFGDCTIKLGSLYPFFSERTIDEDTGLWRHITDRNVRVVLFDSQKPVELDRAVKEGDLLIMGGGPLMHILPLFMVEYAFKKAKKYKIKTAVIGCGVGPLFERKYRKAVLEIYRHADLLILRDTLALNHLTWLGNKSGLTVDREKTFAGIDPAVNCALKYRDTDRVGIDESIALNLRSFPSGYAKREMAVDEKLKRFVMDITNRYPGSNIRLIPMHYFHAGDDDRMFLNQIAQELGGGNITVQNNPLTLYETIRVFQEARFNVGMRFHAILLQTILNGNNYVLDYAEPKQGKIFGFLNDIDSGGFYDNRYTNVQDDTAITVLIEGDVTRFLVDQSLLERKMEIYIRELKALA